MYHVLWLDDQYENMPSFKTMCFDMYGIELTPYKYREEGMRHLEQELDKWDAVLLDAKMMEKSDDETAGVKGLQETIYKIRDLSHKHYLPYFISTGQPDLMSDDIFKDLVGGKFYIKEREDDDLMKDMISAIENTPRNKLKLIYRDVISSMNFLKMEEIAGCSIIDILEVLHYPADHPDFKPVKEYNSLRQTLEYLFRACEKFGLIPPDCIPGNVVNLRDSSLYLAGKNTIVSNVRYGEKDEYILPEYIANILKTILNVGNIHSHTVDMDESDQKTLETFFGTLNARYYIFGLTLQLCDVIVWIAKYVSEPSNANKALNLSKCRYLVSKALSPLSSYEGLVCSPTQDEQGIWHYEKCMLRLSYWNGDKKLKLKEITLNTNKATKEKYPYFAKYDMIN